MYILNYNLSCIDYYEDDNYYWFSELNFNGFYKVDKQTLKSELVFHFPNEDLDKGALFHCIEKIGDWFIFSPTLADRIVIYNEVTKDIKEFKLKEFNENRKIKYKNKNMPKFIEVVKYENAVFFIPFTYPSIVKLNLDSMELEYINDWIDDIDNILKDERKPYLNIYISRIITKDNIIVAPLSCSNHILLFNMITNSSELIEIKTNAVAFNSVAFDGNDYWFIPRVGGYITKWNMETQETSYIEIEVNDLQKEQGLFHQPIIYRNKLYVSSTPNISPYIIDIKTGDIKKNNVIIDKILNTKKELSTFPIADMFCTKLVGSKLNFISGRDFCWYSVDLDTDEVECRNIKADDVAKKILYDIAVNKDVRVKEFKYQGIQELCNYVNEFADERNKERAKQSTAKETVGLAIIKATT